VAILLWAFSEIRHELRHRADQRRIADLAAGDLREKRAIIELQRSPRANSGAALVLGNVEHDGPTAGQYFTGYIRNAGPHMAEDIHVTAALGEMAADASSVPHILPPHSRPEPFDLLVPFGPVTYADVIDTIRAGEPLRVRIDFKDGTPAPDPVIECFVFRLVESGGGKHWVSFQEPCPE
jgi:hypothetical protein